MKRRPALPREIAARLLAANEHTCCICNEPRKHVEIHHIDGNPANNERQNLAVLCRDCHSRVTGDEGLGRRFSEEEVREYKRIWEEKCSQSLTGDQDFINKRKQGQILDLQLKDAQREAAVKEMIRKIEALKDQERQKHPGKHIVSQILAAPDDDPEIFAEAMRRLRKERGNS